MSTTRPSPSLAATMAAFLARVSSPTSHPLSRSFQRGDPVSANAGSVFGRRGAAVATSTSFAGRLGGRACAASAASAARPGSGGFTGDRRGGIVGQNDDVVLGRRRNRRGGGLAPPCR